MLQAIHLRVTACDWGQQKAIHLKLIADDQFVITLQSVYGCESSDIIRNPSEAKLITNLNSQPEQFGTV